MNSFDSYLLRKLYVKTARIGDKLAEVEPLIDWEAFRPIIQPMYSNQGSSGGRPNIDPVIMMKLLDEVSKPHGPRIFRGGMIVQPFLEAAGSRVGFKRWRCLLREILLMGCLFHVVCVAAVV